MADDIAVKVENVSKTFKLPHEKVNSIKSAVVNFYRRNRTYEKQQVLKNVSLEVKKGEFFGIVGRNGSGKSTLLKLLAGIYEPDQGAITINGKLTPFIELGVGFNPDLTGRENVFLNGALLGFNRTEMTAMYDDIVEFAELEKFMDQKLKNYSSGMQVRLAFSIAIRARSDILLLDEVLAVGDADFQRKCLDYFNLLKRDKKTVIFVSHDMESVKKFCDRVVLIEDGEVAMSGTAQEVVPEFMRRFITHIGTSKQTTESLPLGLSSGVSVDPSVMEIEKVWLENSKGQAVESLSQKDKEYQVCFVVEVKKPNQGFVPGATVVNEVGEFVVAANSKWAGVDFKQKFIKNKKYQIRFKMKNIFEPGNYKISVNVVSDSLDTFYAWQNYALEFYVDKPYISGAKANPDYQVEVNVL